MSTCTVGGFAHRILCNIIVLLRHMPSIKTIRSNLLYMYFSLTYLIFRAHHSKSKHCQRKNEWKICENVEEVDPHSKILPLVMQETANQWMLQKVKTTTVNL